MKLKTFRERSSTNNQFFDPIAHLPGTTQPGSHPTLRNQEFSCLIWCDTQYNNISTLISLKCAHHFISSSEKEVIFYSGHILSRGGGGGGGGGGGAFVVNKNGRLLDYMLVEISFRQLIKSV